MRFLADINVWVPLAMSNHSRHEQVVAWFEKLREGDIVYFCRATQQGFLRLITDPKLFLRAALSNEGAWHLYQDLLKDFRIEWIGEPDGLDKAWFEYATRRASSTKLWMDAYLAAFARLHGMKLVSFDNGFQGYESLEWLMPPPK